MKFSSIFKRRVFMDHASATPVDPSVQDLMADLTETHFHNPSALYGEACAAKKILTESRASVAKTLGVRPEEIVFTASGTESDNMALFGLVRAWRSKRPPHIVTTSIEHPAILEACAALEAEGVLVTRVSPDENGIVDPKSVKAALTPDTVLVSVMYANNEIGTIQPIAQIAKVIRDYRNECGRDIHLSAPYFHTDASQAPAYLDVRRDKIGVDLMTLDGMKIYGPKGVGMLYVRTDVPIAPLLHGGAHERGLRPGTENVPAIAGFALALQKVQAHREGESARLKVLQDHFIHELDRRFGGKFCLNGDRNKRLPNNVNICIPNVDSEFAVIQLDQMGIAASAASACVSLKDAAGSYVIEALEAVRHAGRQDAKAGPHSGHQCHESSVRFTMGRGTKKAHIEAVLSALTRVIQ